MNAWLLTWEGTEPETIFDNDNKIVTILSGRMSSKSVEQIVYVLYTRCLRTAGDLSYLANRRKERERLYIYSKHRRGFLYGSNPWIYARRVTDLVIEKDENKQFEHISWKEPPELKWDSADRPIGFEPAIPRELTRSLDEPLSAEIYPRREQVGE